MENQPLAAGCTTPGCWLAPHVIVRSSCKRSAICRRNTG